MKLMDDFDRIRLLINIFMTHNLSKTDKSVNLHKFVRDVQDTFKTKGFVFSEKEILLTWKKLLEEYYYYKENYSTEDAKQAWNLFELMDNCFDRKDTEKFNSDLTFFLIDCMTNYRNILAKQGLTQEVLEAVEKEFKILGNNDINQLDIYNQWEFLKQCYREKKLLMKTGCMDRGFDDYFEAMRLFYQSPEFVLYKKYHTPLKRRIQSNDENENKFRRTEETVAFNSAMRYTLLNCIKNKKSELGFNKELTPALLNYIIEEFKKYDCHLSSDTICNEWNDLYYRYELLKSSENPYHWKYFNDVNDICHSSESVVVESIETNPVTEIDENILDKYSKKFTDMPELRDLMLENNLSGEEVNYLLDMNET
ncbi:unnamed protein product [Phyllotreta striolata]|uniref:Uncharacterized protein n=1 Tax=Phyllotreta striolata TaxID=444603 RepID=A0A9N9TM87_PHYSR|nr:unnamed protein product [Phyllotreta striolata]